MSQVGTGSSKKRPASLNWVCEQGMFRVPSSVVVGIWNNLVENAIIHGTSGPDPRIDVMCQG